MDTNRVDAMEGQLAAIVMTVTALIQHLPPQLCARAATSLEAAAQVQQEADLSDGTPAAAAATRDGVLRALIGALRSTQ